jgi:hypothetical protein
MMLTCEQAAATWCPMVRIARIEVIDHGEFSKKPRETVIVGGCNTDALGRTRVPASCRCIADGCAMWRWESDPIKLPIVVGAEANRAQMAAHRGYCGLAGFPLFAGGAS